jgi:hypothetical protein
MWAQFQEIAEMHVLLAGLDPYPTPRFVAAAVCLERPGCPNLFSGRS